jgi:hypothetical protein
MHEFELGIWRMIFIHLIRLLTAVEGAGAIQKLNERYALVPPFEFPPV